MRFPVVGIKGFIMVSNGIFFCRFVTLCHTCGNTPLCLFAGCCFQFSRENSFHSTFRKSMSQVLTTGNSSSSSRFSGSSRLLQQTVCTGMTRTLEREGEETGSLKVSLSTLYFYGLKRAKLPLSQCNGTLNCDKLARFSTARTAEDGRRRESGEYSTLQFLRLACPCNDSRLPLIFPKIEISCNNEELNRVVYNALYSMPSQILVGEGVKTAKPES